VSVGRSALYHINLSFGSGDQLILQPQQVTGTTITLDINYFLPIMRLRLYDSTRILSQLTAPDAELLQFTFELGRSIHSETISIFKFDTYRRFPSSNDIYDVEAFLSAKNLFAPQKMRSFTGSIKDTLLEIALDELNFDSAQISDTLDYKKTLLQPSWTNMQFINHVKRNVLGTNNSGPFFSYVRPQGVGNAFIFKTLNELVRAKPKYRFTNATTAYVDNDSNETYYPFLKFRAFDNHKFLGVDGAKNFNYAYFDYDTSEYKASELLLEGNTNSTEDFFSLTQYHSIDGNDDINESNTFFDTGRSNDFTSNFIGKSKSEYHRKLLSLNKLWITTWGFEDIYPGDMIELRFLSEMNSERMTDYIYNGFWMVERVVHRLGNVFTSDLMLTRNGIDTMQDNTLVQALNWKR